MEGIASYIYFKLVYDYLNKEISRFGGALIENMSRWASGISLTLVTLWIFFQGYRVISGQSREPMMATVLHMGRVAVIVSTASTMAIAGTNLRQLLTVDLDREVHGLLTGKANSSTAEAIDKNLAWTQLALSTINAVQVVPNDAEMLATKQRTTWLAAFGTASAPMAAGAMLLLYQFAMAIFIGFGPLFILCLIFDQTKELFKRWLMYGIGTIFSMAMLSVVSSMVLELTFNVSKAMWGAKVVNKILGSDTEGLTSTAIQQGGIGLLLTVLIISVPPVAAMFFQGTLGGFMSHSAFDREHAGSPGSHGQPSGSRSGSPAQATATGSDHVSGRAGFPGLAPRITTSQPMANQDRIKNQSVG